jgi:hypothetical protein
MDLKGMSYGTDWINLAQNRGHRLNLVSTEMNIHDS